MPPEPLPWDRKDLVFRERKHEKDPGSDAPGGGFASCAPRWRNPYHGPRDIPRASPRRPPPGHYRQDGGYHQIYLEESGGRHGCMPSRPDDRFWPEDVGFRPYPVRNGGGHSIGSVRESRGSFRRSPYGGPSSFSRQQHDSPPNPVTGPRSVVIPITSPLPSKDHHDNKTGDGADDGMATGHRTDLECSLGSAAWKTLKWNHSGSISLLKTGKSEPDESGSEVLAHPGKENTVQSLAESTPDEGVPLKKQRLGWGEGLAKYERKKVDGSEDGSLKSGLMQCSNSAKSVVSDTNLKIASLAGSACPMTPTSVACSSSPGMEDKSCMKLAIVDNDTSHFSDPSCLGVQSYCEEYILNSLLAELLQPEDAYSGDSSCTRHSALSKLLLLKGDISKELEKTENDIDLFETELHALNCDEEIDLCQGPFAAQADKASESFEETTDGALKIPLTRDHRLSSPAIVVQEGSIVYTFAPDKHHIEVECEHVGSFEMVSSKVDTEVLLGKGVSDSDTQKLAGCPVNLGNDMSSYTEAMPFDGEERHSSLCGSDEIYQQAGSNVVDDNIFLHSKLCSNLVDLIKVSNKDAANRASQILDRFMATGPARTDIRELDKIISCRSSDTKIKEKLVKRRRSLKFKEKVLTIQYRAAYNLWKEDLHLLSIRKQRPKSQKLFGYGGCLSVSGSQKHRSSLRPRTIMTVAKTTLVPTTEMVNFTGKLLSESQIKICRSSLKMPVCILFEERRHSGFITNNGLIEDPLSFEKERTIINSWKPEEKELFMELLATCGKNFTKIASFLRHKTTADCVEFYYKNHKSESFVEVKKRLDLKKQSECLPTNTYLVTSGKKWKHEANAASLNMLGTAAVLPVHSSDISRVEQSYNQKPISGSCHDFKMSRRSYGPSERRVGLQTSRYKREAAANVLAGISGALSSEAMGSCITSSIDPVEKVNCKRTNQPIAPEVTQSIDEEENCSDDGCGELDSVDWTDEEKSMFIKALGLYGKDFGSISHCVGSRSREQCKIFFSKARKCLGLDAIHQRPGSGGTPRSDAGSGGRPRSDANGGSSNTEDVCVAEMDSGICSMQSCSKVDTDFTQSVVNTTSKVFVHAGKASMHFETERSSDHNDTVEVNEDEVETKVDKVALELNEGKSESKGKNSQSCAVPMGGDTAVRCDDSIVISEVPNLHGRTEVKKEVKKEVDSFAVSPVEPCISACMEVVQVNSHSAAMVPKDTEESLPSDRLEKAIDMQQCFITRIGPENGHQMKIDTGSSSDASDNLPGEMVNFFPCPMSSQNFQHQISSEFLANAQEKSISVKQEDSLSLPLNSVLPGQSFTCFRDHLYNFSGLTLDLEKHGNKQKESSITREFYERSLLGNAYLNQVDQPLRVLRGYPVQVLDQGKMTKEPNLVSAVLGKTNLMKIGISQHTDSHTEKCRGSRVSHTRSEILYSRSEEHLDAQLRPRSRSACSENEVESNRNGDVKLFGKVLSHPSLLEIYNSSLHGNNSKLPSPKQGRTSTMKLPSMLKGTTIATTVPERNHLGVEAVSLKNYHFWDGHRIQTGLSKLPESAILFAKCQGSLSGVSLYTPKAGLPCSDGVLSGYQQAYMQALHKRSEFEMLSGLQKQNRAAQLGMNLVSDGGAIIGGGGGSFTGVSDPVTAIKMHYASRANILGEADSWRGDVGSR